MPNTSVSNRQLGLYLSSEIAGFEIEDNDFRESDGNATHTFGVVAQELGQSVKTIRNNAFNSVTVSNEAFGINADTIPEHVRGLRYACNINTNVAIYDFWVPDASEFDYNLVSNFQVAIDNSGVQVAAGNEFSTTGNSLVGDFFNQGEGSIVYLYYKEGSNQEPLDYSGLSPFTEDENPCPQDFCVFPCLTSSELDDEKDRYVESVDSIDALLIKFDKAVDDNDTTAVDSLRELLSF